MSLKSLQSDFHYGAGLPISKGVLDETVEVCTELERCEIPYDLSLVEGDVSIKAGERTITILSPSKIRYAVDGCVLALEDALKTIDGYVPVVKLLPSGNVPDITPLPEG